MTQETEIKIAIEDLEDARRRIAGHGFSEEKARLFERNLVFDLPDGVLRKSRQLLRLRDAGGAATLTYKGVPEEGGKHKSREERETTIGKFGEMQVMLERLGYRVTFIYEKFRTEYADAEKQGTITLDETPIGNFLELEGEPDWIDSSAKRLGFSEDAYLTGSYGSLFAEWRREHGSEAANMIFSSSTW